MILCIIFRSHFLTTVDKCYFSSNEDNNMERCKSEHCRPIGISKLSSDMNLLCIKPAILSSFRTGGSSNLLFVYTKTLDMYHIHEVMLFLNSEVDKGSNLWKFFNCFYQRDLLLFLQKSLVIFFIVFD